MLEDLGALIDRLRTKTLTDSDIKDLIQLLQRSVSQDISQSGKFNVAVGEGTHIYVGDRYTGATLEQIRLVIQELQTLQPPRSSTTNHNEEPTREPSFRKLALDLTTLETINLKLEMIREIYQAGYLSDLQRQELRQLEQNLQSFNHLNQNLQHITEQADRLIQAAVSAMRLQLDALKLAGRTLTENTPIQLSPPEAGCQQAETAIFQAFVDRLEDSRQGADWIGQNMKSLIQYANNAILRQFPALNASEQAIDDFKFSLKQFLEQVSFSLYWGTYEILDSPEIPLVFGVEHYEAAFQAMKSCISKRLRSETIHEIEACLDYLIERLQFY